MFVLADRRQHPSVSDQAFWGMASIKERASGMSIVLAMCLKQLFSVPEYFYTMIGSNRPQFQIQPFGCMALIRRKGVCNIRLPETCLNQPFSVPKWLCLMIGGTHPPSVSGIQRFGGMAWIREGAQPDLFLHFCQREWLSGSILPQLYCKSIELYRPSYVAKRVQIASNVPFLVIVHIAQLSLGGSCENFESSWHQAMSLRFHTAHFEQAL